MQKLRNTVLSIWFWVSWISRWMHEVRVGGRINHISEPEFRIYISMGTQHWKRHVYSCIFAQIFKEIIIGYNFNFQNWSTFHFYPLWSQKTCRTWIKDVPILRLPCFELKFKKNRPIWERMVQRGLVIKCYQSPICFLLSRTVLSPTDSPKWKSLVICLLKAEILGKRLKEKETSSKTI